MSLPFTLEPGERLIWKSRASGVVGYDQWVSLVLVLASLPLFGLCMLPISLVYARFDSIAAVLSVLTQLGGSLLCASPWLVFAAVWALPKTRDSYFLTDRALIQRTLRGGVERIPLNTLEMAQRYVALYRGRYGPIEVVTDRLRGQDRDGREFYFGPSKQIDYVLDLLEYGVFGDFIDLSMQPSVDGVPAPAEARTDLFLCSRTRTDGDLYGPLFIGPTRVVRLTEMLSGQLLGRLYTTLGQAVEGQDAEAHLAQILHNPGAGHYTDLKRADCRFTLDGNTLAIRTDAGASHIMDVSAEDADRLRLFLKRSV